MDGVTEGSREGTIDGFSVGVMVGSRVGWVDGDGVLAARNKRVRQK